MVVMGAGDSKTTDASDSYGTNGAASTASGSSTTLQTPSDVQSMDVASRPQHLQAMLDDDRRAREAFTALWELHVPGGLQRATAPRPLVHEVLLQAAQQLELSASRSAQARELATEVLGGSFRPVSFEDALRLFRSFCSVLLSLQLGIAEEPLQELPQWQRRPPQGFPQTVARELAVIHLRGARRIDDQSFKPQSRQATSSHKDSSFLPAPGREAWERPSRAKIESVHAGLRAAVCNAQAAYDQSVLQSLELRAAIARSSYQFDVHSQSSRVPSQSSGHGFGALARNGSDVQSQNSRIGNNQHVRPCGVPQLLLDLERKRRRSDHAGEEVRRQHGQLALFRKDLLVQEERASLARQQRDELSESLASGNQQCSDLARKYKTEQLRASMLQEAFEQEQSRVGLSLGRAESLVCDLVAATEGTRRVEVEEQAMQRQCASAISELEASSAEAGEEAELHIQRLRRELEDASQAPSDLALVETQRHAAVVELAEARRRTRGAAATARRRAADAAAQRAAVEALEQRAAKTAEDLRAHLGSSSVLTHGQSEFESLQQQLKVLQDELQAKDVEILRHPENSAPLL